jgi:hypothetical protein
MADGRVDPVCLGPQRDPDAAATDQPPERIRRDRWPGSLYAAERLTLTIVDV